LTDSVLGFDNVNGDEEMGWDGCMDTKIIVIALAGGLRKEMEERRGQG
jgi:hypothetical protein